MRKRHLVPSSVLLAVTLLAPEIPSAAAAGYDWSGWYGAATFGWGWRSKNDYPPQSYYEGLGANFAGGAGYGGGSGGGGATKHDGFAFSVGFGYNIQIKDVLVFGIDYEFLHATIANDPKYGQTSFAKGTSPFADIYTALNYDTADGDSNRWYGIFRAKLGPALGRIFPYVTGGAAYRLSYNSSDPTIITYTYTPLGTYTVSSRTYVGINHANAWGWVVGGGVEYALTDALLVKAEYLHLDFGEDTYMDPVATALTGRIVTRGFERQADFVRAGVSYRFNWGYSPSKY